MRVPVLDKKGNRPGRRLLVLVGIAKGSAPSGSVGDVLEPPLAVLGPLFGVGMLGAGTLPWPPHENGSLAACVDRWFSASRVLAKRSQHSAKTTPSELRCHRARMRSAISSSPGWQQRGSGCALGLLQAPAILVTGLRSSSGLLA